MGRVIKVSEPVSTAYRSTKRENIALDALDRSSNGSDGATDAAWQGVTSPPSGGATSPVSFVIGAHAVRAEELGLVVVALALWAFVIALFFNKWGKIRMLEPYQPQYKHQRAPSCPLAGLQSPDSLLPVGVAGGPDGHRYSLHALGVHRSRPRQNSVFVGSNFVARYSLVPACRRAKSAEDISGNCSVRLQLQAAAARRSPAMCAGGVSLMPPLGGTSLENAHISRVREEEADQEEL